MNQPAILSVIGEDSPRAKRSDPETSHESADAADLTGSQSWVLFLLRTYGPMDDVTLYGEHSVYVLDGKAPKDWSVERIRSARHELVERGLVEHVPGSAGWKERVGHRRARVWQAVAK